MPTVSQMDGMALKVDSLVIRRPQILWPLPILRNASAGMLSFLEPRTTLDIRAPALPRKGQRNRPVLAVHDYAFDEPKPE